MYTNGCFLNRSSLWFYSKGKHRNLEPLQINLVLSGLANYSEVCSIN